MSKYRELVLDLLTDNQIKSTNEILKELEKRAKKVLNWHNLYRILMDLESENKIEKLKAKAGFFWKKK